jgi:phosphotransferase family enzyme
VPVKQKPDRPEFFNFGWASLLAIRDTYGLADPVRYCPILLDGRTATLLSVRSPTSKKVVLRVGPRGQRLFLKQVPWYCSDPDTLRFSLGFQTMLAERGFPCARVVPTLDGALCARVADVDFVLFEFVPGERYEYRERQLRSGAAVLGGLHAVQPPRWWRDLNPPEESVYGLARAHLDLLPVEMPRYAAAHDRLRARLLGCAERAWDALGAAGFDRSACRGVHGDFNPWNMQFDAAGEVAAVLDFDNCDVQPVLHDVAEAILTWTGLVSYRGHSVRFSADAPHLSGPALTAAGERARVFLDTYRRYAPPLDDAALPDVVTIVAVELCALGLLRRDFRVEQADALLEWVSACAAAARAAVRAGTREPRPAEPQRCCSPAGKP